MLGSDGGGGLGVFDSDMEDQSDVASGPPSSGGGASSILAQTGNHPTNPVNPTGRSFVQRVFDGIRGRGRQKDSDAERAGSLVGSTIPQRGDSSSFSR